MIKVGILRESDALAELLAGFQPGQGPFVVVPNWHCDLRGYGTDARTLECVLKALPGEKIVVEAYDAARTDEPDRFEECDLEAARAHWDYLRDQDQVFLDKTGIGKVLDEQGAEYLNVTDEIWSGRVADPNEVRELVEKRYGPVGHPELYNMVPRRFWELRGQTLINCAKIKAARLRDGLFFSLSLKNLFGLIPVPNRMAYHGAHDSGLARAIVDANQVYGALFRVISIAEAMHNARINPQASFFDDAAVIDGLGLVGVSDHSVELDAFLVKALGGSPDKRHFLRLAAEVFGTWDEKEFPTVPEEAARRFKEIMGTAARP